MSMLPICMFCTIKRGGTPRSHDLTESTRAMVKRGSDDLKKLTMMQATLVRHRITVVHTYAQRESIASPQDASAEDIARLQAFPHCFPEGATSQYGKATDSSGGCEVGCRRGRIRVVRAFKDPSPDSPLTLSQDMSKHAHQVLRLHNGRPRFCRHSCRHRSSPSRNP